MNQANTNFKKVGVATLTSQNIHTGENMTKYLLLIKKIMLLLIKKINISS